MPSNPNVIAVILPDTCGITNFIVTPLISAKFPLWFISTSVDVLPSKQFAISPVTAIDPAPLPSCSTTPPSISSGNILNCLLISFGTFNTLALSSVAIVVSVPVNSKNLFIPLS